MRERPILFNGAMVRALLDGSKTQTRRIVKLPHQNPLGQWEVFAWGGPDGGKTHDGQTAPFQQAISHSRTGEIHLCPYGQPGERLWVRESFAHGIHAQAAMRDEDGPFVYAATDQPQARLQDKWKPSIFMPRYASRILLEIVKVRVERLQDISEADAKAEGADSLAWDGCPGAADLIDWPLKEVGAPYRNGYALLWESINGDGSWDANPWVFMISCRRIF